MDTSNNNTILKTIYIVQIIASVLLVIMAYQMKILPQNVFAGLCILLASLAVISGILLIYKQNKKSMGNTVRKIAGTAMSFAVIAGSLFGTQTAYAFSGAVSNMSEAKTSAKTDVDTASEPYLLYITSSKTHGNADTNGRANVNIVAAVNPEKKKITLISTPENLNISGSEQLADTGKTGTAASETAIEKNYGVDIDHYVKVNIDGFVKIIDSLGGIEVNSQHMNGNAAYAYIASGSSAQRSENQMTVVKAVIEKAKTASAVKDYPSFIENLGNTIKTDLTDDQLKSIIRTFLNDTDWKTESYNAVDQNSVQKASTLIKETLKK